MPSISVPLKGEKGWNELMVRRRKFWKTAKNNQLTPHFKATEFYCNDGAAVPTVARNALVHLCKDYLEPMRAKFGTCFINSGYRHVLYNASIGGARMSQHIYEYTFEAVAADIHFGKGTPNQWGAELKRLRTKAGGKGGIGIYTRQGFCHVDNRNYKADWAG